MAKIEYISVEEASKLWELSFRSVRNYCAQGRVPGALLEGKTWKIPSNAEKPSRKTRHIETGNNLLAFLKREKDSSLKGGIYHKIQIDLTYNSNHIEGSRLSHVQTRFIFETKTLGITDTFEMNAKTVTSDKIAALKEIGVTHGRMGVQTFNPFYRDLFKLSATMDQIYKGAELLNNSFDNVCVDMLYGMHGQSIDDFIRDLHHVLQLGTKNIDVYPINNSVIQKRLLNAYKEKNLLPASAITKYTYNMVLREYMKENGYLPHNGHGYVRASKDEIEKNPVVSSSYTFQYHETNYGYKGHEIIAFGPVGYSVFDNFVIGNTSKIDLYIKSLLDKNELMLGGIGQYPQWMTDIKGLVLHLPYHGFVEKNKLDMNNIPKDLINKIEFLKNKDFVIETSNEYRLTQKGWYNYVNLLYFLSPQNEQNVLEKFIEERYKEDPWKINLDFN